MVQFDNQHRQIKVKIVYYGPALGGKTTCLQAIHRRVDPRKRTKLYSLNTSSDRTLFFDLMALDLGRIRGFQLMIQLYTVPGQVQYSATRKAVLAGVDGVVFVADSQTSRLSENRESLKDLKDNLTANGLSFEDLPIVFIYNKQDLSPKIPKETFESTLNLKGRPSFGSIATTGEGIMESFATVCESTLAAVADRLGLRGNTSAIKKLRDRARASLRPLLRPDSQELDDQDVVVTKPLDDAPLNEVLGPDALVGEAIRTNLAMADLNTRHEVVTRQLERKVRVMDGIRAYSETVSSQNDPAAVLRAFLRSALRLIEVASAAVSIAPGKGPLREVAVHGLKRDPILGTDDAEGQSLALAVLSARKPLLISRDASEPPPVHLVTAVEAAGFTSALAVPMLVQGRKIGLFTAYTAADRAVLNEDDLHLATVLASTAAMAYVNIQALRRVKNLNQALQAKLAANTQGSRDTADRCDRDDGSTQVQPDLSECPGGDDEVRRRLKTDLVAAVTNRLESLLINIRKNRDPSAPGPLTNGDTLVSNDNELAQIKDLTEQLRTINGLAEPTCRTVDVGVVIKSAMEPLRDLARSAAVQLSVSITPTLRTLECDPEALATALRAILNNAIRYNHREGEVRLEASSFDGARGNGVSFVITDSGAGIPESALPGVFHAYKRPVSDPACGSQGLGAGLAIAFQIVSDHGGDLRLESWLGRGTAVRLDLPQPH